MNHIIEALDAYQDRVVKVIDTHYTKINELQTELQNAKVRYAEAKSKSAYKYCFRKK